MRAVGFWNLTIQVKIQRDAKLLISDSKVDFRCQAMPGSYPR